MWFTNENLLKAISWTLVHSLWQGIVLAILAGLIILFTKKSTAHVRYNILAGLFLVFIATIGFTFYLAFDGFRANASTETLEFNNQIAHFQEDILIEKTVVESSFQKIVGFLNQHSQEIVLLWFFIFCLKCVGIFRNLNHIYRIRNYRTQTPSEFWINRVEELAQMLQIKKKIILLESQLVKVPSVTGFFKPMILIPVGLISHLPQDQVESILLHELAHIRRKDYGINLLQNFAEILFFFNPGVLWVSSIIKEERENCCDDIAVGITKSKSKFINALVSFQEYNMKENKLAVGFGGRKNSLLERAKRIVYNHNKSLSNIEKTFLSICIIMIAIVTVACSSAKAQDQKTEIGLQNKTKTFEDLGEDNSIEASDFRSERELEAMEEAEHDRMTAENDELEAEYERIAAEDETLAEEDERIAGEMEGDLEGDLEGELVKFDENFEKQIEKMAAEAEKMAEVAGKFTISGIDEIKIAEKALRDAEQSILESTELTQVQKEETVKSLREARKSLKSSSEGKVNWERAKAMQFREAAKMRSELAKMRAENARMISQVKRSAHENARVIAEKNRNAAEKIRREAERGRIAGENAQKTNDQIIKKLIDDKIISSPNNLSFKISDKVFYVNDKKMSEAQRKEFAKFLPKNITATYYNYEVSKKD
ncbi:M48 family metalloprotease [Flavobacterium sp. NST-5]|uniref:M48 family metalloprotease n=1 Tax=Flavobacterium ichthyis TaxID=2698827 RepID=A0ABW9Z971_9FLAO|nr:M56 family metallopeptidase [Flavobacterium ichthyis]NBL65122.1 M48 family metalloprotease [Flavobacterium ichthyis]